MGKAIINSAKDWESWVDKDLGYSKIHTVTQEQINKFAEATVDYQWIHTDPQRAAKEGPFGGPIAHGYLSLSLVPYMWGQIVEVNNLKMMINYGAEKLKFNQPVPVGAQLQLHANLKSVLDLRGITKVEVNARMEIVGNKKPVFTAILVLLYHFE